MKNRDEYNEDEDTMSLLDLNTDPISGEELLEMRQSLEKEPHELAHHANENAYPSQAQMDDRMGMSYSLWGSWERNGVNGAAAAMIRLHLDEGVKFDERASMTADEVSELVQFLGDLEGMETKADSISLLADEIGVTTGSVRNWVRNGVTKNSAKLLAFIRDEFGLSGREAA